MQVIDDGLDRIVRYPLLAKNATAIMGSMKHKFFVWFEKVLKVGWELV